MWLSLGFSVTPEGLTVGRASTGDTFSPYSATTPWGRCSDHPHFTGRSQGSRKGLAQGHSVGSTPSSPWLCLCHDLSTSLSSSLQAQQEVSSGHGHSRKPRPPAGKALCLSEAGSLSTRALKKSWVLVWGAVFYKLSRRFLRALKFVSHSSVNCLSELPATPFFSGCSLPIRHRSVHWKEMRTDSQNMHRGFL